MASQLARIGSQFSGGAPDPLNTLFEPGETPFIYQEPGPARTIIDARFQQPMRPAIANMRRSENVEDERFASSAPPASFEERFAIAGSQPSAPPSPARGPGIAPANEFTRDLGDRARMGLSLEDLGFGMGGSPVLR